jgi:hypothetical protein
LLAWIGGRVVEFGLGFGFANLPWVWGRESNFNSNMFSKRPKTTHGCSEKWCGTHKKKKRKKTTLFSRTKHEIGVPNTNFFDGTRNFCFTNMETGFKNDVLNKPLCFMFYVFVTQIYCA